MSAPKLPLILAVLLFHLASLASWAEVPEDWRTVRAAALKAARSDDDLVRLKAFEPLRSHDHEEAAELLMKAIDSSSSPQALREHARDVLSTYRAEDCRELVFRELRSAPTGSFLLLETFAAMGDPRAEAVGAKALADAARSKQPDAITAAAIRCLASAAEPGAEALAAIFAHLGRDKPIGARRAALEAMLKLGSPEAVEALIGLIDDPALKNRAHLQLVQIAGKDMGVDKGKWETWWDAQSGSVPELETLSVEDAQVLLDAGLDAAEADGSAASFYGIPIEGEHVLFVLDASTSMRGYPLERLKGECTTLVTELPETHHFALLFFPGNDCYPKAMLPASEEVKEKAFKFIEKRDVIRGTPVTKAMEYGFRRYVEKGRVDAIYLLSDGAPSNPPSEVLATIDDLNAGRYIPIHTIFIGTIPEPAPGEPAIDTDARPAGPIRTGWQFLKEVARRHDGKFSVVEL